MLAAAKAFSASSVVITDVRPTNLPVALTLGAHYALDLSKTKSSEETVQAIRKIFSEGPDIVIDCVGVSNTITVRRSNRAYSYHKLVTLCSIGVGCVWPKSCLARLARLYQLWLGRLISCAFEETMVDSVCLHVHLVQQCFGK